MNNVFSRYGVGVSRVHKVCVVLHGGWKFLHEVCMEYETCMEKEM